MTLNVSFSDFETFLEWLFEKKATYKKDQRIESFKLEGIN